MFFRLNLGTKRYRGKGVYFRLSFIKRVYFSKAMIKRGIIWITLLKHVYIFDNCKSLVYSFDVLPIETIEVISQVTIDDGSAFVCLAI